MKRWSLTASAFALMVFLLAGCCGQSGFGPVQKGKTYFAFGGGQQPAQPQRIVSMNIRSDEVLLALVSPERIVALSRNADDDGISNITEEAKLISLRITLNPEQIIYMKPDLVLATESQPRELIQTLRDAGIAVHVHRTPHTLLEAQRVIRETADAVGEKTTGETLIRTMNEQLAPILQAVNEISPQQRKRVIRFTLLGGSGGKGTSFDEVCRLAGVVNGASAVGVMNGQQLSKEQIIRFDPEVILLPTWGYTTKTNMEDYAAEIINDPALQQVTAIKNRRLVVIQDRHMLTTSQYMVECVKDVFEAAYPEVIIQ